MPKIVATGQVEDAVKWEAGLRTRGDLLRGATVTAFSFGSDGNEVATLSEVTDVSKFMEMMDSQATADAMAEDGVKRETVRVYVLDKEMDL